MSIVRQNISANLVGRVWTALMSIIFVPFYIKFMGIEAYGLIGFFIMLQGTLTVLDLGLSTTLNRELARLSAQENCAQQMRSLVRTLEIIYLSIALLIGIMVVILAPIIASNWVNANKLSPHTVEQAIMLMGMVLVFQWPIGFYTGGLMGLQRQVLLNVINMIMSTLRGGGAVIVLWLLSPTIQYFFTWHIFIVAIQTIILAIFLWKSLPLSHQRTKFQKKILEEVWKFAAGITGSQFFGTMLTLLDKIILSRLLTLDLFGYYTLAWTVASSLYSLVHPVVGAVLPRFSQLVRLGDETNLTLLYHKSCQFLSVIVLPPALLLVFFPYEILFLWTRDHSIAQNAYVVLRLLTIGMTINCLTNVPFSLPVAYGWVKLLFYTTLLAVAVMLPTIFFLSVRFGVLGAAAAWIFINCVFIFVIIPIIHSRLLRGEQWAWYKFDVGIPVVVAIMTAGIWKWIMPIDASITVTMIILGLMFSSILIAVCFVTPVSRTYFMQKNFSAVLR